MKNIYTIIILFSLLLILSTCKKSKNPPPPTPKNINAYIYTCNNDKNANGIIGMAIEESGEVFELENSPFKTGGLGDDGIVTTQGGIAIYNDLLICLNSGAQPEFGGNGSVSVFRIKKDGQLEQVDQAPESSSLNINSRGVIPSSVDVFENAGKHWVLVTNQEIRHQPGTTPFNSNKRNLVAFQIDPSNGRLSFVKILDTYFDGIIGRPCQVKSNYNKDKVAVITLGIPYNRDMVEDSINQKPSRFYLYQIEASADDINLTPTNEPYFAEEGIAASVAISWKGQEDICFVTNANLTPGKSQYNVSVFDTPLSGPQRIGFGDAPILSNSGCWSDVLLDKNLLFIADTHNNNIDSYSILSDNNLNYLHSIKAITTHPNEIRDILLHPNKRFLYALETQSTHALHIFKVGADGTLSLFNNTPYVIPSSHNSQGDEQRFFGLEIYLKP